MEAVAVAVLWCGTLAWCVNRVVRFAETLVTKAAPQTVTEPMPVDIASAITTLYSEEWAMQDALSAAEEMYRRTQNWDVVRQRMFAVIPTKGDDDG